MNKSIYSRKYYSTWKG